MDRIESKSVGFILPAFTDELVDRQASKSLQAFGEIVGGDEVAEVGAKLRMGVVVVALDRSFFNSAVHALDLAVGPGMIRFGKPVVDVVGKTDPVKRMTTEAGGWTSAVLGQVGELDAVVGEHRVDAIGHSGEQRLQECRGSPHVSTFDQFHEGELRGAIDGHEEVQLALGGAHLGQIDVEVADRTALELLPAWLAAFYLGQPTDTVPLQAAMQR